MLPPPALRHACDLTVSLDPARELGDGRAGRRRIIPIVGGRVDGPLLSGRILPLGADWQTVHADGHAHLDTRYAFETGDGALIEIVNIGIRRGSPAVMQRLAAGDPVDPAHYYMRTHARLETGHPDYLWVNTTLFLGTGAREADAVRLSLFVVD
jgi:hypothetical protein